MNYNDKDTPPEFVIDAARIVQRWRESRGFIQLTLFGIQFNPVRQTVETTNCPVCYPLPCRLHHQE